MVPVAELPKRPPAGVLAEVYAAHRRMQELDSRGVEVDFSHGPSGELRITLSDEHGTRLLRPAEVFDVLDSSS